MLQIAMESQEASSPKHRKLDEDPTDPTEDQSGRRMSCYASKVSRRQYLDERTADVYFLFKTENKRVPAHKSVLSKASNVFDKMFYEHKEMVAKKDEVEESMEVPDGCLGVPLPNKSAEAFEAFLQFSYLDEVTLKLDIITEVMELANEYQMFECLELCGRFWADNWTIEDICSAYSWAINFHMTDFKTFCERKISIHCIHVFQTPGFLSCAFPVLKHILELESLLCNESMVLGACLDWARYACEQNDEVANDMANLRKYLTNDSQEENLLYKIRYGSMTHQDFITHLDANDGLFADVKECEDIMRLLLGSKNLKTGKFNTEPREPVDFSWNENQTLECNCVANLNSARGQLQSQRFVTVLRTNRPILLGGFFNVPMSRSNYNYSNSYAITVEISIKSVPRQISENETPTLIDIERVTLSDHNETYFKPKNGPIVMRPDFEYLIEFYFDSTSISYHKFNLKQEIKLDNDVVIDVKPRGDDLIIKRFIFNLL